MVIGPAVESNGLWTPTRLRGMLVVGVVMASLCVAVALVVPAVWLLVGLPRLPLPRLRCHRHGSVADEVEQVLKVAADLQRLERELASLRASDSRRPGLHVRLAAVASAYDETLLHGGRMLHLPVPVEQAPIPPVERVLLEARLTGAGVRW